jgi:FkbM family methyltransferase
VNRYQTKRRLLRPLTAWRRRRVARLGPYNEAVFRALDFRPTLLRFRAAAQRQPDLLVDVDLPAGAVVLDVGAYEGQWSTRVLAHAEAAGSSDLRIHAFEPDPGSVALFRSALGDDPRVVLHPFGLGGRDRTETLTVGGAGSSLFVDPDTPGFHGVAQVELRDVDAVLRSLQVDRVDLVKVNIEGGEYELFDRLDATGWLARTGTVFVQFHEFAPNAYRARRRVRRALRRTHDCTWNHTWVFERWDPR